MKLTEVKHKHLLTDILKVLLFSIIMLVPILSVATRCLYVIVNKNAYQSAEITQTIIKEVNPIYEYETNRPNNIDELIIGNAYSFADATYTNTSFFTSHSAYLEFTIISGQIEFTNLSYDDVDFDDEIIDERVRVKFDTDNNLIIFVGDVNLFGAQNDEIEFTCYDLNFVLNDFDSVNYQVFLPAENLNLINYEVITEDATTLDNVFEYSVNKLNDNPLINWTQQTAIYTGVNTMTTQLGITNAVIPMLIVYWFLMTVIYIIIDIVIKLFTYLTHMIGNKTT